ALVTREVSARLERAHEARGVATPGRCDGFWKAPRQKRDIVARSLLRAFVRSKSVDDRALVVAPTLARALRNAEPRRTLALDTAEVIVVPRRAARCFVRPLRRQKRGRLRPRRFADHVGPRPRQRVGSLVTRQRRSHRGHVAGAPRTRFERPPKPR